MTFEARNRFGHTYNHDEVFSKSKKKTWRPRHHELAFGQSVTRPPWYRSQSFGGVSELPEPIQGRRYDPKDLPPEVPGSMLHYNTGESWREHILGSSTVKGIHEQVKDTSTISKSLPRNTHSYFQLFPANE